MQFSKATYFLLPTDEKQPTDLEKSFACLTFRGLKNPTDKIIGGILQSAGKLQMSSVGRC